jgi:16S rRNA (guanine527-N7)-methyltransferase
MSPEVESPLAAEGFETLLRGLCPAFELDPAPTVLTGLGAYLGELDVWRRRTNLTGNLSADDLVSHALESVLGADLIVHGERVVDIGSGAGFPGLPLAIARPDLAVALVEPRAKRCAFLRHVARTLALQNVHVTEKRIEEVGGQTFEVATTRAVGSVSSWLGDVPFLCSGGALLAWTTEPESLALSLPASLRLEKTLGIPGSRRKVIALYRRGERGR